MLTLDLPARSGPQRGVLWLLVAASVVSGSLQEIAPVSDGVYWLNLLTLCAITVLTLMRCVFTPAYVSLWDYFAGMIGMIYGLGTLNTDLKGISSFRDLSLLTNAPPIYVHQTLGYVSLLMGLMLFVGLFARTPLLGNIRPASLNKGGMLLFGAGTAIVCVVLVATGAIGYHGNLLDDDSVTPSAAATYAIFCAGPAAAGLVFMWGRYKGAERAIAAIVLLILFVVNLYLGRRNVTYALIVCMMAHFLAQRSATMVNRQSLAAIALALALLPMVTTGFMAMRMASYETPKGEKPTVGKLVVAAIDVMAHDRKEIDRLSDENLRDRTYLVGYLAELAWRTEVRQPLHGRLLLFNVGMSIPRAVWPMKFKYVRVGSEEALAHPRLGMPSWDAANSVLTTGMTDFGPIGMIAFPVLILGMNALLLSLIRRLDMHVFAIISFALLTQLANVEGQLLSYFTFVRDVIIVSTALFTVIRMGRFFAHYNKPLPAPARLHPVP